MTHLNRRDFIKLTGASLATSCVGALGFGMAGEALAATVRPFKLAATAETRNTCTYCSVACGILIYSLGDRAKNATSDIIHIEGDPDHRSVRIAVERCIRQFKSMSYARISGGVRWARRSGR